MRRLIIWPQAETDVDDAVIWYEEQHVGLGDHLLDELNAVIARVVQSPLQFPRVAQGVRRALLYRFPYSVYFRLTDATIDFVAFLHHHRDPASWQKRLPGN